jgi:hypothetical protein
MQKFRKKNDDWVLSIINYHLVSIWTIFNGSEAFTKSESYTPLRMWSSIILVHERILLRCFFHENMET